MKQTYLAGGMESAKDNGTGWRDLIKHALSGVDLHIIDPTTTEQDKCGHNVADAKRLAHTWKKEHNWDKFCPMFENIIKDDLHAVETSDFIILYLNPDVPIGGTISEMTLAYQKKIPIYCYLAGKPEQMNSWVLALVLLNGKLFKSWKELIKKVKEECA